jgi:hypothetical protein
MAATEPAADDERSLILLPRTKIRRLLTATRDA